MMCSRLEPGITVPITSNVSLSEDERLATQPLARLSPITRILFFSWFGDEVVFRFYRFFSPTIPEDRESHGEYSEARNDLQSSV